jgi:hypothetical protein
LFNWYKKLGAIRNKHLALQKGKFQELIVENDANVFAFARFLNKHMFCLVAVNRSNKTQKISIPLDHFEVEKGKHLENIVTGNRTEVANSEAVITLPPIAGAILSPEEN